MKYFRLFIIFFLAAILFAEEDPMGNMTIEYGPYDILQKESASSQGKYYPYEYYENVIQYVQEGNMLASDNKLDKAIEKFDYALKNDPKYVFALNGMGNTYLKKKDYENAEKYFKQAIKYGPDYSFPYNNLANLYIIKGKDDEALNLLLQALKKDPNSARINYNIGNLYLKDDKLHIARSYFQKAIKFDSNFCNARYNLAITYWRLNNEISAIEQYEKLVSICPGHSKGVLNLAAYYIQSGQTEKALILYKQAVLINPDSDVFLALGHAYHNAGYAEKEIDAYRSSVMTDSTNTDALYYLALAYYEQKMLFSSKSTLDELLKIEPENENAISLKKKLDQEQ